MLMVYTLLYARLEFSEGSEGKVELERATLTHSRGHHPLGLGRGQLLVHRLCWLAVGL
jgi:hypothetical protein